MSWWKRLVEKSRKFVEDVARDNGQMWKGGTPSCCAKDKNKELPEKNG